MNELPSEWERKHEQAMQVFDLEDQVRNALGSWETISGIEDQLATQQIPSEELSIDGFNKLLDTWLDLAESIRNAASKMIDQNYEVARLPELEMTIELAQQSRSRPVPELRQISGEELVALANRCQPPQSWYDEESD